MRADTQQRMTKMLIGLVAIVAGAGVVMAVASNRGPDGADTDTAADLATPQSTQSSQTTIGQGAYGVGDQSDDAEFDADLLGAVSPPTASDSSGATPSGDGDAATADPTDPDDDPAATTAPGAAPAGDDGNNTVPAFTEADFLSASGGFDSLMIEAGFGDPRDSESGPFSGIGTFRVFCHLSHQNYDDPIVFPNDPGRSHHHTFFGNTTTDAATDVASMATTGNSTCQGGIADRSAYWVPSLYNPANGELIEPWIAAVYYQTGFAGLDPASIQPIPAGLRMISGDHAATPDTAGGGFEGGRWGCFNGGGAPSDSGATVPDCADGAHVSMIVTFPQCWDGTNLDASDHKSHMAFPRFGSSSCPSSHPVALPAIMLQVLYPAEGDTSTWRISSDHYDSGPGGASLHADFVNGWDPAIMNRWVDNCIRAVRDCERSELGGGDALEFPFRRP